MHGLSASKWCQFLKFRVVPMDTICWPRNDSFRSIWASNTRRPKYVTLTPKCHGNYPRHVSKCVFLNKSFHGFCWVQVFNIFFSHLTEQLCRFKRIILHTNLTKSMAVNAIFLFLSCQESAELSTVSSSSDEGLWQRPKRQFRYRYINWLCFDELL